MSEENVRIVQAGIEAYNAQNWDALREMHAPSVIARTIEGWPEPGPFVGRDAVMRQFARVRAAWDTDAIEPIGDFLDAWESVRWDPEEIIEVDETRLIVLSHVRMRGRGSGVQVDATAAQLWTITDGKARRIKLFQSKAEALEAAGLSE